MKPTNLPQTSAWVDVRQLLEEHEALDIRYRRDQLICQSGTYAAGIHLVVAGIVQESYTDPESAFSEVVLLLRGTGQLIGSELLLPDPEDLYRTTFRAVTDVELRFLERSVLEHALEETDVLWRFLLGCLARNGFERARAQWRTRLPGRERLATLLLDMAPLAVSRSGGGRVFPNAIDVQTLAGLLCLSTRQTKRLCAALPGVCWSEGCLSFSPPHLTEWLRE